MTYKDYAEKAKEILKAIKDGNYEEDLEAPNFVRELDTPDGRKILIVFDADGPKTGSDCGWGAYTVCGEVFNIDFDFNDEGEIESSFFDLAENLEGNPESIEEDIEELIDEIKDELSYLKPDFSDVYAQADAYAKAMGIGYDEAYWCEDPDCPSEDDFEEEDYEGDELK